MGDKGKRDKGKREEQKKGKHTLKEKRKQKKINEINEPSGYPESYYADIEQ